MAAMPRPTLQDLLVAGEISALDRSLAEILARIVGEENNLVLLGAAIASARTLSGDVCADLERLGGRPAIRDEEGVELRWPGANEWKAALSRSDLVTDGTSRCPLVLDGAGRLYLHRYWDFERRLGDRLLEMAGDAPMQGECRDPQELAVEVAGAGRLTIITGGPGTGKTYTVARILLSLFQKAREAASPAPRVILMAPTGKAAARLRESMELALLGSDDGGLDCDDDLKAAIPTEASTIHRALGWSPSRRGRFNHDRDNPLPADIIVVDEASMVDLALMTRLVEAVPSAGRLIILGDRDQLASVESGAVLGDICNAGGENDQGPLSRCLVSLTGSYRFGHDSGIGRLARAVLDGDIPGSMEILREGGTGDVRLNAPVGVEAARLALEEEVVETFREYLGIGEPAGRLEALSRCRILCAHRRGPLGATDVNGMALDVLHRRGHIDAKGEWFDGRPVMITSNDPQLGLFNGDVGVTCVDGNGQVRIVFDGGGGEPREFSPARLPACETVFATTVHKAQGSQYERVVFVLPMEPSPVTTKELLYTAVTRASDSLAIYSAPGVWEVAAGRRVERSSGLRDRLWGGARDQ